MKISGALRLGMRKLLEVIADEAQREAMLQAMIQVAYERGKAIKMTSRLDSDAVIDPADARSVIISGLAALPRRVPAETKLRLIDAG